MPIVHHVQHHDDVCCVHVAASCNIFQQNVDGSSPSGVLSMKGMLRESFGWPAANSSGVLQPKSNRAWGWVRDGAGAVDRGHRFMS